MGRWQRNTLTWSDISIILIFGWGECKDKWQVTWRKRGWSWNRWTSGNRHIKLRRDGENNNHKWLDKWWNSMTERHKGMAWGLDGEHTAWWYREIWTGRGEWNEMNCPGTESSLGRKPSFSFCFGKWNKTVVWLFVRRKIIIILPHGWNFLFFYFSFFFSTKAELELTHCIISSPSTMWGLSVRSAWGPSSYQEWFSFWERLVHFKNDPVDSERHREHDGPIL